jgi:hypothetical protein
MKPVDPMAIAVDWLDAYRAARINQIVGMYSADAVIECACGGRMVIYGQEGIAAYWRRCFIEMPALELEDCRWMDGPWLSPTVNAAVRAAALNSGCIAFLTKPFSTQQLMEPLNKAAERRS